MKTLHAALALVASLAFGQAVYADSCHIVFEGINSHIECSHDPCANGCSSVSDPSPGPSRGPQGDYYVRQPGLDYPGNDLASFKSPNIESCTSSCQADNACNVAAYLDNGACYLKSARGTPRQDNNVTTLRRFQRYPGRDTPGSDLRNFGATGWQQCAVACVETNGCIAFVLNPLNNACWLKSGISTNQPQRGDREIFVLR